MEPAAFLVAVVCLVVGITGVLEGHIPGLSDVAVWVSILAWVVWLSASFV